uniref:Solute carrier family 35 member F1 n=1 Tax=Schistocephalus solidus TaxID=70667 RepID=A0A0V0J3X1_SCHSO
MAVHTRLKVEKSAPSDGDPPHINRRIRTQAVSDPRSDRSCGGASNAASPATACASGSVNDILDNTDPSEPSLTSVLSRPKSSRFLNHLRRLTLPIALGQILSALIAITGIASNFLVRFGVSLPLTQNLPSYFLLATIYGFFSWRHLLLSQKHPSGETVQDQDQSGEVTKNTTSDVIPGSSGDTGSLQSYEVESCASMDGTPGVPNLKTRLWEFLRYRGWQYFVAGTIDVHANWAIVSAYSYTNLTSVQLLDCLTIPTAMLLSRFCLKTRYGLIHVAGVFICLLGAGAMVGADYLAAAADAGNTSSSPDNSTTQAPSQSRLSPIGTVLLGDFLVILGAIGYGMSNVYQEYLVRRFGIIDYLSFASLTSTLWTVVHCLAWELPLMRQLAQRPDQSNLGATLGCLAGYAAAMFILYNVMPFALSRTNAVLVNLSLLTADLYALLIGIYLFGNVFHPLYIGAFLAIVLGLCLFASRDPIFKEDANAKDDASA